MSLHTIMWYVSMRNKIQGFYIYIAISGTQIIKPGFFSDIIFRHHNMCGMTKLCTLYPVTHVHACIHTQFHRKEVIGHYVEYVNNFTDAMALLQKNIKKRPKFVTFLKEKYHESKTSLSLQGLLLKPVQRFPQYILFLQVCLYIYTICVLYIPQGWAIGGIVAKAEI